MFRPKSFYFFSKDINTQLDDFVYDRTNLYV